MFSSCYLVPPAASQAVACSLYKIVALDIDGTVLNSAQQVTPELKETLAHVAELGLRIVLCTGRRWRSTVPVLAQLQYAHPLVVCCGGALVKRLDDEQTLFAAPMEHEAAQLTVRLFRQAGLVPMLLYDRPLSGIELLVGSQDRGRAEKLPYLLANSGYFQWYEGDYPDGAERPLEVYAVDSVQAVRAAERAVSEGLKGAGVARAMLQPRYGADQIALEVHAPHATKWNALKWLLRHWNVRPEEVIAIGDDVNDIPMLEAAGMSFAMGNAPEKVKAAARRVTASNDDHGVALALQSLLLGREDAPTSR